MRRRAVLTLLGGAMFHARASVAQQKAVPTIGFLAVTSMGPDHPYSEAFHQGLSATGFRGNRPAGSRHNPVQEQNVAIEYRYAEGRFDLAPALVADLVARKVDVIVTTLGVVGVRAVKAATTTTPIVFFMGDDPVARGLVASFAQPGGNVTGVSWLDVELMPKRLDLMMELVPRATAIGLLVNPKSPNVARVVSDMQKASRVKGVELLLLKASTEGEIEAASATLRRVRVGGLIVSPDPFFLTHRTRLVALAAQRAVPAVYDRREYANAGGLISYGASLAVGLRQLGVYTGKILTGTRPAELPVVQPTAFELVINSKTANALGLALPQSLILRAEQVIG